MMSMPYFLQEGGHVRRVLRIGMLLLTCFLGKLRSRMLSQMAGDENLKAIYGMWEWEQNDL